MPLQWGPSCRGHTGAPQACLGTPPRTALRRRLVPILHPGRPCAAGSSRSSTPDALAPQARLDPPPGWRARRGLLPSARTAGCVVAFVIAELRAPSRSSTAGGATPHASQSCSREPPPPPLACPPRAAPLSNHLNIRSIWNGPCAVQHGEVALFWTLVRSPRIDLE